MIRTLFLTALLSIGPMLVSAPAEADESFYDVVLVCPRQVPTDDGPKCFPVVVESEDSNSLCNFEDEVNKPCVWDAMHQGNCRGQSFRLFRDGTAKYISHRRAVRLLGEQAHNRLVRNGDC